MTYTIRSPPNKTCFKYRPFSIDRAHATPRRPVGRLPQQGQRRWQSSRWPARRRRCFDFMRRRHHARQWRVRCQLVTPSRTRRAAAAIAALRLPPSLAPAPSLVALPPGGCERSRRVTAPVHLPVSSTPSRQGNDDYLFYSRTYVHTTVATMRR